MNARRATIGLGTAQVCAWFGLILPSDADAQVGRHPTPLARAEANRLYPDGGAIRQEIKPSGETMSTASVASDGLAEASPAPASPAAVQRMGARFLGARAGLRSFQLAPLYSTRVGVTPHRPEAAPPGGFPMAALVEEDAAEEREGTDRTKHVVSYELLYQGVPLAKPTSSTMMVGGDGKVLLVRERNIPATEGLQTTPTVKAEDAVKAGRDALKAAIPDAQVNASKPSLEIYVDARQAGQLAWAFTLATRPQVNAVARKYWVAARDEAKVLRAEDLIYNFEDRPQAQATQSDQAQAAAIARPAFRGTVTGTIIAPLKSPVSQPDGEPGFPLPFLSLRRNGSIVGTTTALGTYGFLGAGTPTITANLSGKFCVVSNQGGARITRSRRGTTGGPNDLAFDASGELELAQTSVYYFINLAHQFASEPLSNLPPGPGRLDRLTARVNIADSCNAFWDGSALNFFKAGDGCPNTAYGDVVMHEYGHGIDAAFGGIVDGAYSEGFGDSVAMLVLQDPVVGRDFFGAGQNLRDGRDVIKWPPSNPEVHFAGQVYAGFTWELTQQLKSSFGGDQAKAFDVAKKLILGAAAMNPKDIPDAVALSFVVDDDDNDLSNGTPNDEAIKAAAKSRDIPLPSRF